MTRGRTAWVIVEPNRVLVKGWNVGTLLMDGGMRPTYAGSVKAWILDRHRLADVVALLEYRNVSTTVTDRDES